jgi:hypothetical protein
MTPNAIKTKVAQATNSYSESQFDPTKMAGIDDIYSKIVNRVGNINSKVNDYASKYGVLKLEKEHDLEPDVRLIPQAAALAIADGVLALSTAAEFPIPPNVTMELLSKIKVPFRTIIFVAYLALDIARIAVGVSGPAIARKILSIVLAIVELLKGDWKKAVLSLVGYYGMIPLLVGELMKVFLTLFRMLAPQIQNSIVFGSLDAAKSFVIGLLLAIFQVTAPEEVRLPLIGALEKIAKNKAQMDGVLEDIGLSARPDYLSPSWNDLNNIQAVMSDEDYICSCEFQELVKAIDNAAIIKIVLQILRIPANKEMIEYKCGNKPCKDFVTTVVSSAKERTEQQEKDKEPFSMNDLQLPVSVNSDTSVREPIKETTSSVLPNAEEKNDINPPSSTSKLNAKGGRILHSRKRLIA